MIDFFIPDKLFNVKIREWLYGWREFSKWQWLSFRKQIFFVFIAGWPLYSKEFDILLKNVKM